jgi:hypothetical protein
LGFGKTIKKAVRATHMVIVFIDRNARNEVISCELSTETVFQTTKTEHPSASVFSCNGVPNVLLQAVILTDLLGVDIAVQAAHHTVELFVGVLDTDLCVGFVDRDFTPRTVIAV